MIVDTADYRHRGEFSRFELPGKIHPPLYDLKLFPFQGTAWVTFNDGHPSKMSKNSLLVGPLDKTLARCRSAEIPGRNRIEKNWGFFEWRGELNAVYSLQPLTIVRANGPIDGTSNVVNFSVVTSVYSPELERFSLGSSSSWAIGSQPIRVGDSLVLTVHQKTHVLGKFRRYYVHLVQIEIPDSGEVSLSRVSAPMIHSLANLRARSASNPFAFGVTYASGIERVGDHSFAVGYGIRDRELRIVSIKNPFT